MVMVMEKEMEKEKVQARVMPSTLVKLMEILVLI